MISLRMEVDIIHLFSGQTQTSTQSYAGVVEGNVTVLKFTVFIIFILGPKNSLP